MIDLPPSRNLCWGGGVINHYRCVNRDKFFEILTLLQEVLLNINKTVVDSRLSVSVNLL